MQIDRDKLRSAVCRLDKDRIRNMLDDAIGLLSPAKLAKLAERYVDLASLQATKPAGGLLAEVKAFDKVSRAGEYFGSFDVNSKSSLPTKADRGRLALTGRRCCRHGSSASRRSPSRTILPGASSTLLTGMPATPI